MSLIARFMDQTWGPSGADKTQVGPTLASSTLLSWILCDISWGLQIIDNVVWKLPYVLMLTHVPGKEAPIDYHCEISVAFILSDHNKPVVSFLVARQSLCWLRQHIISLGISIWVNSPCHITLLFRIKEVYCRDMCKAKLNVKILLVTGYA